MEEEEYTESGYGRRSQSGLVSLINDLVNIMQTYLLLSIFNNHSFITIFYADPYEELWQTQDVDADKCDNSCDALAACACGLVYGDYKCACPKGYYGSGDVGQCTRKQSPIFNEQAGKEGWWNGNGRIKTNSFSP